MRYDMTDINNTEEEINGLADKFVETKDLKYRDELLNKFSPYFKKYVSIFCGKDSIDLNNKDTLAFMRLFMSPEETSSRLNAKFAARNVIQDLRSLFNDYTSSDLYDEMVCNFLEQIIKYKPIRVIDNYHNFRISFTHFMQVNLRFKLQALVKRKQRDAMHSVSNIEFTDEFEGVVLPEVEEPIKIDWDWVEGKTAGEGFEDLDESERYLIYIKYANEQKDLSDYDVADRLGNYRMNIYRKFNKIREKLSELRETPVE